MKASPNTSLKKQIPISSVRLYRLITFLMLLAGLTGQAAVFNWVTVGDAGNTADDQGRHGQFGAVADTFRIASTEVTNDQYAEFLNKVAAKDPNALFNLSMDITRSGISGRYTYAVNSTFNANPVNFVNFYNSMRFVNWLENGQPTGAQGVDTTEAGVYTIGTGLNETRAPNATYFLPSEDEWYKAAYYDPRNAVDGGPAGDDNYWLYPTQSDEAPTLESPAGGANSANCSFTIGDTSDVGAYTGTTSYYGAFDLGGNLWEWNEEVINSARVLRGGSYFHSEANLRSSVRHPANPVFGDLSVGFRVASSFDAIEVVPEPGTVGLMITALAVIMAVRKRRE